MTGTKSLECVIHIVSAKLVRVLVGHNSVLDLDFNIFKRVLFVLEYWMLLDKAILAFLFCLVCSAGISKSLAEIEW